MKYLPVRTPLVVLIALFLYAGCTTDSGIEYGPPAGWEGVGERWWLAGQDTSGFYPRMETLDDMALTDEDVVFLAPGEMAALRRNDRSQFERAVKRSLIRLFRNEPVIVDSLFEAEIKPMLPGVTFTNDPVQDVETFKRRAYKHLARFFREPRARLELGTDVPVVYPDSLREQGIGGAVVLQVRLDAEGTPFSVELIEGVHPVLDQIAMEATTRMRWLPAYLMVKKDWQPVPAWARFRISFSNSTSEG
ncbi:MAG: energy transducer TonB [Rhodothermales bacterium]|nr:energy transducer TonB [Rhodothermales bacterium]